MLSNFYKHTGVVSRLSLVANTMGAGATETWSDGDTFPCLLQEQTGEEGINADQTQANRRYIIFCDPTVNVAERDRITFSTSYTITPASRTTSQITASSGTSTGDTWASNLVSLNFTKTDIEASDTASVNSSGTNGNSVTQAWDISVQELIGADYTELSILYYAAVIHNVNNVVTLGSYDWTKSLFTTIDTDDVALFGDGVLSATVSTCTNMLKNNIIRLGLRSYKVGSSHILKTNYMYLTVTATREYEVIAVIDPGLGNHHKELFVEQRG